MLDHDDDVLGGLGRQLAAAADSGLDPAAQASAEAAVERRLAHAPSRGRRMRAWVASHVVVVAAAGVVSVAGAGATAAVVIQQAGTPSHAAEGEVPRVTGETRKRDLRYEITMGPSAEVGRVGWCSSMMLRFERTKRPFGGGGCGSAPLAGRHVITGGTTYMGQARGLIAYSVVDDTVAYALTTDTPVQRLVPASDPTLPNGWRVIVQLPGETHTGNLRYRDAQGRRIKTAVRGGEYADRRLPTDWSKTVVAAGAPCALTLPAGATPRGSRWLTAVPPTPGLAGRALVPCAQTRFKVGERWAEATVFLDAERPGRAEPMPLPGTATRRGEVDLMLSASHYPFEPRSRERLPNGDLPWLSPATARRLGNSWLAIRAGTAAERQRLLDEVQVGMR